MLLKGMDVQTASSSQDQFLTDVNTRIRDLEEKQRLLKDRLLLIGQTLVEEREKNFSDIQEMKKSISILKKDNERMKQLLEKSIEELSKTAKRAELEIIQRQLDIMRE